MELVPLEQVYNATAYLICGKHRNVIIETGASRSNGVIRDAMTGLGLSVDDIHAIVVTHIHLDHSGGAGLLMEQCPNATLYVHEKGAPHLVDPEKLISGSRAVYGDSFDHYFLPVLPVPEHRIHPLVHNDRLDLGGDRVLQMIDSPGHALHHMAVFDPESRGIFTGDAAGIYYHALEQEFGVKVSLPSTTPTQFDPNAMLATLNRMLSLDPARHTIHIMVLRNRRRNCLSQPKTGWNFLPKSVSITTGGPSPWIISPIIYKIGLWNGWRKWALPIMPTALSI